MVHKAILKKPWRSPRGKLYPVGSTFKFSKRLENIDSTLYNFDAPGIGYGIVVLPNKIFKKLTDEEKYIRDSRKRIVEEHMRKISDPFIRKKI